MTNRKYQMTQAKLQVLCAELKHRVEVDRLIIAERLKAAIERGNLAHNADYHSTKALQGWIEGRIYEVQEMISNGDIIE